MPSNPLREKAPWRVVAFAFVVRGNTCSTAWPGLAWICLAPISEEFQDGKYRPRLSRGGTFSPPLFSLFLANNRKKTAGKGELILRFTAPIRPLFKAKCELAISPKEEKRRERRRKENEGGGERHLFYDPSLHKVPLSHADSPTCPCPSCARRK